MMAIQKDGTIKDLKEFRNAWGFPAKIWNALSKRAFKDESAWLINRDPVFQRSFWDLWKNSALPKHWRVCHALTFDYAIVSRESAKSVAKCLRDFSEETFEAGYVDHLPAIADELEKLPDDCIGACFYGNSVSENPWRRFDEKEDHAIEYDVKTGNKHFFVLEEVEGKETVATI